MIKPVMMFAACAVLASDPVLAQAPAPAALKRVAGASSGVVPRTADGKPNFEGDWVNNTFTPLERPNELKDKPFFTRSEEHTSELQSQSNLVCRLLLEKKKTTRPAG